MAGPALELPIVMLNGNVYVAGVVHAVASLLFQPLHLIFWAVDIQASWWYGGLLVRGGNPLVVTRLENCCIAY